MSKRLRTTYNSRYRASIVRNDWLKLGVCKITPDIRNSPFYCTDEMERSIGQIVIIERIQVIKTNSSYYLRIFLKEFYSIFAEEDIQKADLQDLLEL